MTDNHFSYTKSVALAELLDRRAVSHLTIRPYTPRTNGKVERFHQTLMREWAYALEYASSDARREALPHWLDHYNEATLHSAPGHGHHRARTPYCRFYLYAKTQLFFLGPEDAIM